jgi:general secretion pathway protein C
VNRFLTPINYALALLIIAMLALIASDFISFRISKMFPRKTSKAAAVQPAPQGALTPLAAKGAGKPEAAAFNVSDFTLLGTVQGSPRESFALILKNSSKEERVFRMGDNIFNAGPLALVRKDYIEIQTGATRTKLATPAAAASLSTPAAPAVPAAPSGGTLASQTSSGNFVIDQRALNAALDNIGQAMTDARLLPSVKEGKVEGFRVSEVKPQGIFGTIGIKNGDVLLRMNDFPIDSPEKAIQSFATLKGQSRIKLDLIRDGQPTTFNYDIR